jgi:sugar phosphate isomerase/epimerase
MGDWPVGLSTGCFHRIDIEACLEPVRDAGFSILEICSFPAHLNYHDRAAVERAAERLRSLALEAYSFHAPFAERIDITAPNPEERELAVREILAAAEAAAALGVRYLVIHPGPEKHGLPADQRLERMRHAASTLDRVAERCAELGIGLLLENMLPHLFSGHVEDLLWLLGALRVTGVGICLDTGHAFLSSDLGTVVPKLSGHLRMVHASDNRGQFDDHLPPGEGKIHWPAVAQHLHEARFAGAWILEISGNEDPADALAGAQRGRSYLRSLSPL